MATKISERAHGGGMHNNDLGKPGFAKAYSFGIVTAILFLLSWAGQFIAQIVHERNEARQHGESFMWADFWPQFLASTLESGSPSSCRWCGRRSVLRCCFCGLVAVHGGRRADRGQARPVARGTRCRSRRGDPTVNESL
jgi:hypothetical protein